MATAVTVVRSIPTPTAGVRPPILGPTHRDSRLAARGSVIHYPASNRPVGQRRYLIPRAGPVAADSPGISAEEGGVQVADASGATTAGTGDASGRTTETDPSSETSEAENEKECTSESESGTENGNVTSAIGWIFLGRGGRRHLRYEHDHHHREEIFEMREMCPWALMPSEQGGGQGTARSLPAPPIPIPCLLRRPSAVDSSVEVEGLVAAEGTGIRGVVGTGVISTMIEIVSHEVGHRKAGGGGSRMIEIVGTAGILTRPGTCEMIARSGRGRIGSVSSSVRSRTGYRTNRRLQRMSRPRLSPPPRPPSVPSRVVSRHRQKYSP